MLDDFSLEAIIAYAEAHPVIAILLLVVAVILRSKLPSNITATTSNKIAMTGCASA